jgi:putative restriction endonuclease
MEALKKYIHQFQNLRIDTSKGFAPHKPILLLSVIDLIEARMFVENQILLIPELVKQFSNNWSFLVTSDKHSPTLSLPFYHLKSADFWQIIPKAGFETVIEFKGIAKSINNLSQAIDYVKLADDLFILLNNEESRNQLRLSILEKYFPETKNSYLQNRNIDTSFIQDIENQILNDKSETYRTKIDLKNEEDVFVRGSIFKITIPRIYAFTCCISGIQIIPFNNISFVDACHIKPFSLSKDDTISNGITLCPNLHRAFDRGLLSIDEAYKVVVSDKFSENKNDYSLKRLEGKRIILPQDKKCYPNTENLKWHLENVFRK